jgi:hypothetical protein
VFVVCFWQNYEKVLYVQVFRVINLLEIIVKLGLIRRGGWLACARYFSTDYHGLTRMGFLTEVFFFRRGELARIGLLAQGFFPRIITDYHGWLAQDFFFATVNYQGCSWIGLLAQAF